MPIFYDWDEVLDAREEAAYEARLQRRHARGQCSECHTRGGHAAGCPEESPGPDHAPLLSAPEDRHA